MRDYVIRGTGIIRTESIAITYQTLSLGPINIRVSLGVINQAVIAMNALIVASSTTDNQIADVTIQSDVHSGNCMVTKVGLVAIIVNRNLAKMVPMVYLCRRRTS